MKINIKDIANNTVKLGDKVQILKITDDSGSASDMYGVESHLNAWVEIIYIEPFEGIVTFDGDKLMVVIKGKNRSIALSKDIRYDIWNDMFDRIDKKEMKEVVTDLGLVNSEYETIIDYLKIL